MQSMHLSQWCIIIKSTKSKVFAYHKLLIGFADYAKNKILYINNDFSCALIKN